MCKLKSLLKPLCMIFGHKMEGGSVMHLGIFGWNILGTCRRCKKTIQIKL
jgi:hypothetical protein